MKKRHRHNQADRQEEQAGETDIQVKMYEARTRTSLLLSESWAESKT